MGLFGTRKKTALEMQIEGPGRRAAALADAQHELQVQQEREAIFKARAEAQKARERAEKIRLQSGGGGGGIGSPQSTQNIIDVLSGGQPRGKKKKETNIFKM
jgi:hypothetical protein